VSSPENAIQLILRILVDEIFCDYGIQSALCRFVPGVALENIQIGFPSHISGGQQEQTLGLICVIQPAILMIIVGLAYLGGICPHKRRDVVRQKPELDFPFGIGMRSRSMD
jgi:hypothetical protein